MKKKLLKFSKKLLVVLLILCTLCFLCLYNYGKTTVNKSSESDFMTHEYYVKIEDISPYAINAIVDMKDNTFWTNSGISLRDIKDAILTIVGKESERTSGEDNITQKLVGNVFLKDEEKVTRKIKEEFIAVQMDNKYTKRQILEFYFNNTYFANGCYTIEAASQLYFGKPSSELTLSEAAYICAISSRPEEFDPYKDITAAVPERNQILDKMFKMGDITQEEYNYAINESVILKEEKLNER